MKYANQDGVKMIGGKQINIISENFQQKLHKIPIFIILDAFFVRFIIYIEIHLALFIQHLLDDKM